MKSFTISIVSLGLLMLVSCQSDPATSDSQAEEPQTEQERPMIRQPQANAQPITKPDPKVKNAWSILTVDLWHYNFALSVNETPDSNIYEGYWIDFEDDFSYRKGYYDEVVATGYYDFDIDSKILEIIPEEGDDEPSQWTIKTNGEVIIMIGTSKFGNNATQIKLVRERQPPKR